MNKFNITVNTYNDTSFNIDSWNLTPRGEEPERICIRRGKREYSLVFDENEQKPKLEIWDINEAGEIGNMVGNFQIEEEKQLDENGVHYEYHRGRAHERTENEN